MGITSCTVVYLVTFKETIEKSLRTEWIATFVLDSKYQIGGGVEINVEDLERGSAQRPHSFCTYAQPLEERLRRFKIHPSQSFHPRNAAALCVKSVPIVY
jgi:hypothetical protein